MSESKSNKLAQLIDVGCVFRSGQVETHALRDINLEIETGDYLAITGESGAGKSTLLSILGMIATPTSGDYVLAGQSVKGLTRSQIQQVRAENIGFIFQAFHLIDHITVEANVQIGLKYLPSGSESYKKRVADVLEKVGLSHRMSHYPSQLSGGQRQRVAIARALVGDPKIILADEPTGNLDSVTGETLLDLFDVLHKEGRTLVVVTHSESLAARAARSMVIRDGRLVGEGHG